MIKNSYVVHVTLKTNGNDLIFYVYNPTTADFSKKSPSRDLSKQLWCMVNGTKNSIF